MATITLYASKINLMPSFIGGLRGSVADFKSELFTIRKSALSVDSTVCNLEEVANSVQITTQTHDDRITALENFKTDSEIFINDAIQTDEDVATEVNKSKEDFYDKYEYLKPDCEKGWLEVALEDAGEWCKEHWKLIVTVVIVVVAVCLICTGIGGIIGAMAVGALLGAAFGGLLGGCMNAIAGKSFWEGFENGAFSGVISGIISGGMGFSFTGGKTVMTLAQTVITGAASSAGSSLLSDIGDHFIKGESISFGQMAFNTLLSGVLGAGLSAVGYGLTKGLESLATKWPKGKVFSLGRFSFYTSGNESGFTFNYNNAAGKSIFRIDFSTSHAWHYHLRKLFGTHKHMPLPDFVPAVVSGFLKGLIDK